jgi:phage tail-like protein
MLDANDTRQHALLGEDWTGPGLEGEVPAEHTRYDATRGELTLEQLLFRFPAHPRNRPVTPDDRRGAAADRFGTIYWVSQDHRAVQAQLPGDGSIVVWWPEQAVEPPRGRPGAFSASSRPTPPKPHELGGLCVTTGHELLVGTRDPAGLLLFDLRGGGAPTRATWPAAVPFEPYDLAARPNGGAVVLDRANRRLWYLDRTLAVEPLGSPGTDEPPRPGAFAPTDPAAESPACQPVRRPSAGDAISLPGDPLAVDVLPDGTVLVLERSLVRPYRGATALGPVSLEELAAHDLAVTAGDAELVVAVEQGDQAYAHSVVWEGDRLRLVRETRYLPMRRFEGRGVIDAPGGPRYDSDGRWRALLCVGRPRHASSALVTSRPLDGREPGCVWHRVVVDAAVPPGTRLAVEVRAAETEADLAAAAWRLQPAPVRRSTGSEIPWQRWEPAPGYASWELLVQEARGRWAQVRLRLIGDGRQTPRIRALRLWYPRFSYLERYLPHAYREEPVSASFLDRFLANAEGTFTALEDRVAHVDALLDPRSAPPEALDWLGSWFDVALDPAWDEARRRLFLRHAMQLFSLRGTELGMQIALRLALDARVDDALFSAPSDLRTTAYRIVDSFRLRRTPGVVAGDPSAGGGSASGGRWAPTQGAAQLDTAWGRDEPFPLTAPAEAESDWRTFAAATLGFVPWAADNAGDPPGWSEFLTRRYGHTGALATAYGRTSVGSFGDIPFPRGARPDDGPPQRDWFAFEAVVLPMRAAAHRFTVLLPVCLDDDEDADRRKRAFAERVVEAQAPAHTVFDVRLYWSAFRVGEARVGMETVVQDRSRLGRLLGPAVLGRSHLGSARLGGEGDVLHR